MLKGIDHIVVVTPNLDTAIQNYTRLGFTVVPGGRHPTGTHNALIAFGDGAYIELVAFYEPHPEQRWHQILQMGGGLADYCMQTDALEADAAAFRAAGIGMTDKYPLSRVRPDGYKLDWVLAIPTETAGFTPFLIEDITPRAERVAKQTSHANGVTGIGRLTILASDAAAAAPFGKVANSAGTPIPNGMRYQSGAHQFDFVTPTGAGALADWLAQRGNSIYAATLKGGQPGALDPALALNANFTLE